MTRVALPLAAAALALAVGAVAETIAANGVIWTPRTIAANVIVGVTTIGAGVATWIGRPDSRVGPLMVAMGGLWFVGDVGYGTNMALVDLVGFPLQGWHDVLLVVLLLVVTAPVPPERAHRILIGALLGAHLAVCAVRLLLRPPLDISACLCVPNRITGIVEPEPYETLVHVLSAVEALLALAALGLITRRWLGASGPARRTLGLLLAAGAATVLLVTYNRVATRVLGGLDDIDQDMLLALAFVRTTIPIAVAWSLLRGRRARARVADVLVQGVEEPVLRRALADPSVQLLRGDEAVPEGRTATVIEQDGERLGALVHDPALREEPELLDAVVAAARLALSNERSLAEVRASRERLVAAVDEERRRLERDLHDGAQQRLVALSVALRSLQRHAAEGGDIALADDLDDLAGDLDSALAGIRELARGIRPPLLVEGGLKPALAGLAAGAPVATDLDVQLSGRLPDAVESTLYFVASEGLANALRHADAAHIRLAVAAAGDRVVMTVTDDGRGGADPGAGSGLVGLADRLEAIGGSLEVTSNGGGTTLAAYAPLALK